MKIIPMINTTDFSEKINIDNIVYTFNFQWNSRGEFWVMDILIDDTPKVLGIKLVAQNEMLQRFKYLFENIMYFFTVDPTGNMEKIGINDFSNGKTSLIQIGIEDFV
jgi:hypothetical protein